MVARFVGCGVFIFLIFLRREKIEREIIEKNTFLEINPFPSSGILL